MSSAQNAITGTTQATTKSTLNLSLLNGPTIVKTLIGVTVSLFAVAATTTTVLVIVLRSDPRYPVANPDIVSTFKLTPVVIGVISNDLLEAGKFATDQDKTKLSVVLVGTPSYGSATLNTDKTITYTPYDHFAGFDQFTYTIKNTKYMTEGYVNVTVINNPPEPQLDTAVVSKNVPLKINPLLNDLDIDNDTLTVVGVAQPEDDFIIVTYTSNSLTLHPYPSRIGSGSFSYYVSDGNDTSAAQVDYTLLNDPPVALPEDVLVYMNTPTPIYVLANDYDPNDDRMYITGVGELENPNSQIDFTTDPSAIIFTPEWGLVDNSDSFSYSITDTFPDPVTGNPTSATSSATVTIVNRPPFANDVTIQVPKNSASFELLDQPDMWGDEDFYSTITITLLTTPQFGSIVFTNTSINTTVNYLGVDRSYQKNNFFLSYTPFTNYIGTDTIRYRVSDGYLTSVGVITINIINSPPSPKNDYVMCMRRKSVTFNPLTGSPDASGKDTDPNGDTVYLDSTQTTTRYGISYINPQNLQEIVYTPNGGYVGNDYFTVTVRDGYTADSLTNTSIAYITVYNTPPIAVNDFFYLNKSVTYLLDVIQNDTDVNGDPLNIIEHRDDPFSTVIGTKSIVNLNGRDYIQYVPAPGQIYDEDFYYTIWDNDKDSVNATAKITVSLINNPPIAIDDYVSGPWRHNLEIYPIDNDFDYNPGDTKEIEDYTGAMFGFVSKTSPQSFLYSPTGRFKGEDQFTYSIKDSNNAISGYATVYITITNTPPNANTDTYDLLWGEHLYSGLYVMSNDDDIEGDSFTIVSNTFPQQGVLTFETDHFTYTPGNILGNFTFQYTVSDTDLSSNGTVNLNVYDNAPIPNDDLYTYHFSSWTVGWVLDILQNDNDVDNDPLIVLSFTQGTKGVVSFTDSARTTLTYKPNSPFRGSDTFTYIATDGLLDSTVATVTITLTDANAPIGNPDFYSVHWRSSGITLDVCTNDTDADGDMIYITSFLTGQLGGLISFNPPNNPTPTSLTYVPNPVTRLIGADQTTYTISDQIDFVQVGLTVMVTNTDPVGTDDIVSAFHWRTAQSVNVVNNDVDADSDPISVLSIQTAARYGTVAIADTSSIKYTILPTTSVSTVGRATSGRYEYTDSCTYFAGDGSASGFTTANVRFTVYNTKPVAYSDVLPDGTVPKNSLSKQLNVMTYGTPDTDADANDIPNLKISILNSVSGGAAVISADKKSVLFTPQQYYDGIASFRYKINDGQIDSDYALVTFNIQNIAPNCVNLLKSVPKINGYQGKTTTYSLSDLGCTDPDGDVIKIVGITGTPSKGTASYNSTSLSFRPSANRSGLTSIQFILTDNSVNVTITASINIVNTAPTVAPDTFSWVKNAANPTMVITANDVDADTDVITVTSLDIYNSGTKVSTRNISFSGISASSGTDGTLTVIRTTSYYGTVQFYYSVTDSDPDNPLSNTGLVTLTVTGYPPVAVDDSYTIAQASLATLTVMSNDYNLNNDAMTLSSLTIPQGSIIIPYISGNNVMYPSTTQTCSTQTFQYTISSITGTATATVTVNFYNCYCLAKVELFYVVDASGSIGSTNFSNFKTFLKNLTNKFNLDLRDPNNPNNPQGPRAGMDVFSSSSYVITSLGWVSSNSQMNSYITGTPYITGSTNTIKGLQIAWGFVNQYGQRTGSYVVYFVGTDGGWNTGGDPKPVAVQMNAISQWKIIALGIGGGITNNYLIDIAYNPTKDVGWFLVGSWTDLKQTAFVQSLVDQICNGIF